MTILSSLGDAAPAEGVGASEGLAAAPAAQPARPRARRRHFAAARELRRKRPRPTEPLDGDAARRRARTPFARTQCAAAAGRLRPGLSRNTPSKRRRSPPCVMRWVQSCRAIRPIRRSRWTVEWRMVAANAHVAPLLESFRDAGLLKPPINVLRLSLSEGGLAPRIANLPQWRAHLLARLRRQAQASCDPALIALLAELEALAPCAGASPAAGNRRRTTLSRRSNSTARPAPVADLDNDGVRRAPRRYCFGTGDRDVLSGG